MRRFSSYGPIDTEEHYYAPREALIEKAYTLLIGTNPKKGGHYITVWAPRQCGKTWIMQEAAKKITNTGKYAVGIISMERAKEETDEKEVLNIIIDKLQTAFGISFSPIGKISEITSLFTTQYFQKPVILILDEFDALEEVFINRFAAVFRDMFISRTHLLHGLALVGVRSVLGIENVKGSPFNVQRSLHIPQLTQKEVKGLFQSYEKESGQNVEPAVIDRLFYETGGQPGLTCWFGELLTEGFEDYVADKTRPIRMKEFERVYGAAIYALPNNNILNIISKARQQANKILILEMFQTDEKLVFTFDDPVINALYMNGVADKEVDQHNRYYLRFACPFIQKRLFNYFSRELFRKMGQLVEPFADLDQFITPTHLHIRGIMNLYQKYLDKNKSWLFKDVPRRSDLRVFEAIYHFNLFAYIDEFLRSKGGRVLPEFPTGNGKIDLLIRYEKETYGIELKSYTDQAGYRHALEKAAAYGKQLQLQEIYLVVFVETIDEKNRKIHEEVYSDSQTRVVVKPIFIQTGTP